MSDVPPPTLISRPRAGRVRRLLRVGLLCAVVVPVVAIVSVWVATRSWFIILMAAPALEQRLGGEVRIRDAGYRGDGVLVFEDVTLRTRTQVGAASQAMRIARAEVSVEFSGLLGGGVLIRDIALDGVLLRLSEDGRAPGSFSISGLRPTWSGGSAAPPPTVRIASAVIEVGTHIGHEYRLVGQRRVTGEMYPDPGGGGWYKFQLHELDNEGRSLGTDGLIVNGRWNVETHEHEARLEGLALDDRTFRMCPQMAKLWWERMQPEGPVGTAKIRWTRGEAPMAELDVDRMALTIPIAAAAFSASYQGGKVESVASLPRMYVHSGKIRLEGNQLTLDNLIGEFGSTSQRTDLVGMPYRVNLSIHDLPAFDWRDQQGWMEQVVTSAPFEMSVRMENFSLSSGPAAESPAVELPRQVADTLAKFNLSGWSLSTKVEVARGAPLPLPDGVVLPAPIQTKGQAYISKAHGAFQGFPYPLADVDAFVEFDSDLVTVHYLTAKGSGDATIRMSGTIEDPGPDAVVSLHLTARDVPLDDHFRAALTGGQLETFDIMLHRPSYEMLVKQRLLPDQAAVDAAKRRRQELVAQVSALPERDPARPDLLREIERLATIDEAGAFVLGGLVDLDLDIERAAGAEGPQITGRVNVQRAGVVYGRFPYPIYVRGGTLAVSNDRVIIEPDRPRDGISISTPGGGRGRVTGEVRLVRGPAGTRVEPDLEIDLRKDTLSDLLYAALPMTKDEKEELAKSSQAGDGRSVLARLLSGAGLSGWLNHTGTISADATGRPRYDFAIELYDGKARPNEQLFDTMRDLGLPSPRGVTLDDVDALLQVTTDTIRLVDFVGHRGDARISADARIDLDSNPIETEVTVEFDDLELERYMLDLAPGQSGKTQALWDRYKPQGRYDAKLVYEARGGKALGSALVIWPQELKVTIDGQPVSLLCNRGEVRLRTDRVTFDDMVIDVRCTDRDDGIIELDGSYGLAGTKQDLQLNGSWASGELASPLILEALRLIGAESHAARYKGYAPSGTFDASFKYESAAAGRPAEYEFVVRPRTLGMDIEGTPIHAELDDGAEILFSAGRIVLRDLDGRHDGGAFSVDGRIDVNGPIDADLVIGYTGRIDSGEILVLLPRNVRSTVESMQIHGDEPVTLTDGSLRLTQSSDRRSWETAFLGLLHTKAAAMKIGGVEFTEVDGIFEIKAGNDLETGPVLSVVVRADRALAKGRELTNVEAEVDLTDRGTALEVPELRADSYGGVITGRAAVGLEAGSPYDVEFDVAGVSFERLSTAPPRKTGSHAGPLPSDELYGSFRVSGLRDAPETRRGRGSLRVVRGRMADMPVALRVLQLFELMPPLSGTMDFASVDLYVDGGRIVFEELYLECPTLLLIGEGEMTYPGFLLDVRFRMRGTVPLWADLVAGLSDQLFLVEVRGPIDDPQARLVALPALEDEEPDEPPEPVAAAGPDYAEKK